MGLTPANRLFKRYAEGAEQSGGTRSLCKV